MYNGYLVSRDEKKSGVGKINEQGAAGQGWEKGGGGRGWEGW